MPLTRTWHQVTTNVGSRHPRPHKPLAVFTLVTRGRLFLTSASKFNIEANGKIFDVSPKHVCASPNVKTPSRVPRI